MLVCAEGGPGENKLRAIIGENVSIHYFVSTSGIRLWDMFKGFTKMGRYLRETKPKVICHQVIMLIHFQHYWLGCIVMDNTPICQNHQPGSDTQDNVLVKIIRHTCSAFVFHSCDGVLSLGEEQSKILRKSFPKVSDKLVAVNNPLITDDFSPKTTQYPGREKHISKNLIAVGRLRHQKRLDVLLHAFAKVKNDIDCRLVILGEGEDRTKLQVLSTQLGIAHLIQMPGFISNVPEWLARADLFVLSSDYEGLPGVVLEALAVNCPVVATDCFPDARIAGDGNTMFCVTIGDVDALAAAIYDSLNKTDNTMELSRLTTKYRVSAAVENHINALNTLIHQGQSGEFQ